MVMLPALVEVVRNPPLLIVLLSASVPASDIHVKDDTEVIPPGFSEPYTFSFA
jgi:hypothetical protein